MLPLHKNTLYVDSKKMWSYIFTTFTFSVLKFYRIKQSLLLCLCHYFNTYITPLPGCSLAAS